MSVSWDWDEPTNKPFPEVGLKGGCTTSTDSMEKIVSQITNLRQYTRRQPEPKGWVDEIEYECTRG